MIEIWENDRAVRCVNTERPLTHSLDLREEGLAVQATRKCSVAECDQPHRAKGLCVGHYGRAKRHGDPTAGRPSPVGGACTMDGCDRPNLARGWCSLHYSRWERNGDPLVVLPNPAALPGALNCKWIGPDVGYGGAHDRVRSAKGSATGHTCADCGQPADGWSYDHLDPDERIAPDDPKRIAYSAKVKHYQARCNPCHWKIDHPTGKPTRT